MALKHKSECFFKNRMWIMLTLKSITRLLIYSLLTRIAVGNEMPERPQKIHGTPLPAHRVQALFLNKSAGTSPADITLDYPFASSVFPPDLIAPTFLWHDPSTDADTWVVEIRWTNQPEPTYLITDGAQTPLVIDAEAVNSVNEEYQRPEYEKSAKAWTPAPETWKAIKRNSVEQPAIITIYGLNHREESHILSMTSFKLTTSSDPINAPIFYRDVPLMPTRTTDGQIRPIESSALPLISWRLRDISKPKAPVVLSEMPTCANCHSFSADGGVLGMDMDGPGGDKGAYAVTEVSQEITLHNEDILTWNDYKDKDTPPGHHNFGLFSQVSPDGRYVVSTLNESVFIANYPRVDFLQSFYPTRGILVIYDRQTGKMSPLPGADDPQYVHTNGTWSPDGTELIFSRALAKDSYASADLPTYASDPRETFIQYDLYRIPFNNGKGGTARPVTGASDNGKSNSFPKYSPDGKWIVFVKANKGQLMRPDSKLFIIPSCGGFAREMNCNLDPMNSWHSWSPDSRWLVFSSKGFGPFTKMFLTHIDENGNDTPAVLIPNSTAANRAVNIPEFLNGPSDAITKISAPTQRSYALFNEGQALANEGKYDDALDRINESIEKNPHYAMAYYGKGFILFHLNKKTAALDQFYKAIELDPRMEQSYKGVIHVLQSEDKTQAAINYLEEVLKKEPFLPETQLLITELQRDIGNTDAAIKHARFAAEVISFDPDFYRKTGILLTSLKKYEEAIACFQKGLNRSRRSNILYWVGRVYQTLNKTEEARKYFLEATERDPTSKAHYNLAQLNFAAKDLNATAHHLELFLKPNPDQLPARIQLAETYKQLKNYKLCANQYEIILQQKPQNIQILDSLAWLLCTCPDKSMIDPARSVELARQAAELSENKNPVVLDTLAVAYAINGQNDLAISTAQTALELLKDSKEKDLIQKINKHLNYFQTR